MPEPTSPATPAHTEAPSTVTLSRLLTVEEAAGYLAISRSRLYEMLATGEVESVHIGSSRRIPVEAVVDFVSGLRR